jgi:hypothetical protein
MVVFESGLFGLGVIALAIGIVVFVVSNKVHYQESIAIAAPLHRVFAAVQCQQDLMRWSAWPAATQSTCRLVGADNQVGATIEFLKNGKVQGSQTITDLKLNERVTVALSDPSPFGQKPCVTFHVRALSDAQTEVVLEFNNTIRRPFHLLLKLIGVVRWVREMHLKDLAGLKAFCEAPPEHI